MSEAETIESLRRRVRELELKVQHQAELIQQLSEPKITRRLLAVKLNNYSHYPPRPVSIPSHYASTAWPDPPPRIGIVIPSYMQGRFLGLTLESILVQGYPNLAVWVQDGGSTDESVKILESYGSRIGWESKADRGQSDAINKGHARVSADIMAYLNSDDLLLPGSLAAVAQAFARNKDLDLVYGNRVIVDPEGLEIGRWVLPPHDNRVMRYLDYIPQETLFWRRRVYDDLGGFDDSLYFALDWDFILRAMARGFRFRRLPRFLACFRVQPEQKSIAAAETGRQETLMLRRREFGRHVEGPEIRKATRSYLYKHALLNRLYKNRLVKY